MKAINYYPGGMTMPGRAFSQSSSKYRFGFNGKENDNEVKGTGNQQDYGMRIYDPRLVRFLSVDPIAKNYPWNSTYSFAENDFIRSVDLDGLEKYIVFRQVNNNGELMNISIQTFTDKNGNLRDNEIYKNKPQLKKADVYVITENINTGSQIGKVKYQDNLTREQDKVYKQFGVKKPVEQVAKSDKGSQRQFDFTTTRDGTFTGNIWNDGFETEASLNLNTKLTIPFIGGTDMPTSVPRATNQLRGIAQTLNLFPNSNATITGNTGNDVGSPDPTGNSPAVLNTRAGLNGQSSNIGAVMGARANAIKGILNRNLGINNTRLSTRTGTNSATPTGRTVDVKIAGINL